jgi:hypothetical protein
MVPFSYYEHKYLVHESKLTEVRTILDTLFQNSDPFPTGAVDSIYFDTLNMRCYRECLNGDPIKRKFRVRGYGDGLYRQLHVKMKNLSGVGKIKCHVTPIPVAEVLRDDPLLFLQPKDESGRRSLQNAEALAMQYGLLLPCVRVRYQRNRYRIGDYRVTLDYNIQIDGLSERFGFLQNYAQIPQAVVEVKTTEPTPRLPLLGLVRLPATSFSKFFIGITLLKGDNPGLV